MNEKTVFIAPNATVVGDVTLGEEVSVWYGAVIRADTAAIRIGARTNIQDNCILHDEIVIGEGCTIGHGAIVHGCTIGDHSMVGMGAIVLSGAKIGSNCVIAAGALVKENMDVPDGHLVVGLPGKIVGPVRPALTEDILENEEEYVALGRAAFGK